MDNPYIVAAISGLVAAIVSAGLTYLLANKAFRSQRWWERKATAYTTIIMSLFDQARYAAIHLEQLENGYQWDPIQKEQLNERVRNAALEINKAIATGGFLISKNAALLLIQLNEDSDCHPDEEDEVCLSRNESLYKEAIQQMQTIAKKDLNVQ